MQGISDRVRAQCRLIAEHARLVSGSPRAILLLYDETRRRLVTTATTGAEVPLQQIALDLIRRNHPGLDPLDLSYRPTANPAVAAAFVGQQTQVNSMAEAFENILPASAVALAHGMVGITHVVSCPVVADGRALGLIRFLVPARPSDAELALMEAAASQIGLTLANAKLADETRRQLAATQAIADIARLGARAGVGTALQALVERVGELTAADAALVYLVDPTGESYAAAAESVADPQLAADISRREAPVRRVGTGLVGWVLAAGEAAFVPDVRLDPRAASQRRAARPREATIIVPMKTADRAVGCLRLSVFGKRRFTEADLWLAQTVADQTVLVVQIAEEQERTRASARTAGALSIASAALREIAAPAEEFLQATARAEQVASQPDDLRVELEGARAAARRIAAGVSTLRPAGDVDSDAAELGRTAAADGSLTESASVPDDRPRPNTARHPVASRRAGGADDR
jgi:GAF domain-containing protein